MTDGTQGEAHAQRESSSPLRVIGLLVLFLACAAAVLSLARDRSSTLDFDETVDSLFGQFYTDSLGLDQAQAFKLPKGETLVEFAGDEGRGLHSLTFIRYPRSRGEAVIKDQVRSLEFESKPSGGGRRRGRRGGRRGGGRGGGSGGHGGGGDGGDSDKTTLQDAGQLDWADYRAEYARVRKGGDEDFYDTVRVNLSTGAQCLIGYVRFAKGVTGEKGIVEELLTSFDPLDASEEAPEGAPQDMK